MLAIKTYYTMAACFSINPFIVIIIKDYFLTKMYEVALLKLSSIEITESVNEENIKNILLFTGRSYLGINDYKKAFAYFTRLKEYDEKTASFWIDQTVEKMKF